MNKKDLLNLLNDEPEDINKEDSGERILIIDGMNLFLRNFAILNFINDKGVHIGGLAGFLRSLGSLIKNTHPTRVYVVFDGIGSSINRKNLVPEYKSNRMINRITNFKSFNNLDEEHSSKINQIECLVHYLRCLPIKLISLEKCEADDIIAYLSTNLTYNKPNNKVIIVSADNDFAQLINDQINIFRPMESEFYTPKMVKEKFNVYPHNFIIYKTLMGDNSDKIVGVKGLGAGKLAKLFPEVLGEKVITLEEILKICEEKYDQHVIYSRFIFNYKDLEKTYKIMNLSNPMLDDKEKDFILSEIAAEAYKLDPANFLKMYHEDGLGSVIKNVDYWIREVFDKIDRYNRIK